MRQHYEVTVKKQDKIFTQIEIMYDTNLILLEEINSIIEEVLKEYSVNKGNVISLDISKENRNVKIELVYTEFDFYGLINGMDEKNQIIAVLQQLDYSIDKIKVSYEEKSADENDKVWKVKIFENYYPDEIFSQMSCEANVSETIRKILGLKVSVSIY